MGVSRVVAERVTRLIEPAYASEDACNRRTLAWLVPGLLLEQDARLPCIALAMPASATLAWRQRRLVNRQPIMVLRHF